MKNYDCHPLFTSIRDRSRYQACDRASTFSKETYEFNTMLKRLQNHLLSDCKYNPFKFCNTSDNEKL